MSEVSSYRCPECGSTNYLQARNPLGPLCCGDCRHETKGTDEIVGTWWRPWVNPASDYARELAEHDAQVSRSDPSDQ